MKYELTLDDVLCMYTTVVGWNSYANNHPEDKSLSKIYHTLTMEEYFDSNEFLDGYKTHDCIMELDGICDMVYTGFFWAAINGLDEEKLKYLFEYAKTCCYFGGASLEGTVNLMNSYLTEDNPYMFVKEL